MPLDYTIVGETHIDALNAFGETTATQHCQSLTQRTIL